MDGQLRVSVLGPVQVRLDDAPVAINGARVRRLLTRLAMAGGAPASPAELADAVWDGAVPADPTNALQTLVSRLRRTLGSADAVVQDSAGYRLAVAPEDVDVIRFRALARDGRRRLQDGDPSTAAALLREAIALWHGEALADLTGTSAAGEVLALEEERLAAQEDRIDADLQNGRAADVIAELDKLVADHPLRERPAALLIDALDTDGRTAEALRAYERLRRTLADELGADPTPALQHRHAELLGGEVPLPRAATNLRAQLTSFLGREAEVAQLRELITQSRLITLVGPGGAGKTRLACEVGASLVPDTPDGVWLVELASVTDPVDLAQAVVGSLGVRNAAHLDARRRVRRDAFDRLVDALADKDAVLLIDNCEHLIEAAADLVDRLLARCPRLRVMATSREPLGITGEVLFSVPPLRHGDVSDPAAASASPAVRLFADRARAVNPALRLDEPSLAAVVEICRRLDGLPLAIELAAARTRTMSVEQIAARLDDRFRLLTGGSRTALPRHRTLRAVVDWSWELLTDAERELAERIAVFPAGVTPESASAALDGEDAEDLLAALVDRSLLQFVGGTRYRMLETLREYGTDRLAEEDELAATRERHGEYFRSVARRAEPALRSAEQLRWIALIDDERDNFFAAITYFAEQGDGIAALEIAGSLGWFLTMRGEHDAAMTWMGIALDVPGTEGTELRAQTLGAYALNRMILVDASEGMRLLAEADADLRPYVQPDAAPLTMVVGAVTSLFSGNEEDARVRLEYGMRSGNPWTIAALALVQAQFAENAGDLAGMREAARVGMDHARPLEERFVLASLLELEGKIKVLDGDLPGAIDRLERSAELAEAFGNHDDAARDRCMVGMCYLRLGDAARARETIKEARDRFEQLGSTVGLVLVDAASSQLARHDGDLAGALDYADAAVERVRAELSAAPPQILAMTVAEWAHAKLSGRPTEAALDDVAGKLAEAARGPMQIFDMPVLAEVAVAQAQLLARRGEPTASALRLGVAENLRGCADPTNLDIADLHAELTERLGEMGFAEAFESGRAMSREDALDAVAPDREGAPLGALGAPPVGPDG